MPKLRLCSLLLLLLAPFILGGLTSVFANTHEQVDFETQIAPIFRDHCIRCHRPGNSRGDTSLSTIDHLRENDYLIDGDPDNSYLVELITSVDGRPPEMPQEGKPLSDRQVDLIRDWIDQGSKWPEEIEVKESSKAGADWWAFQPLAKSEQDASEEWPRSIDDFVDRRLSEKNLARNPPADRRTLIRRATYDLIGLPPTPEEVETFLNDHSENAYENLIDRLLASPHYGERWGRHWLDVVRFGESVGFERNNIIDSLWPFRDYVIKSFNDDKPYDQLIHEHLAGDVMADRGMVADQSDAILGTAFLVAGPYDNVNNQDAVQAAQIRANTLDEIIRATSEAFLGLTIGCARCHDHKFDPITQSDYYSLYASFSGVQHGPAPVATEDERNKRAKELEPLNQSKRQLEQQIDDIRKTVLERANAKLDDYRNQWTRPPVDRSGTTETFETVQARYVRLVCEAQDVNPNRTNGFRIDEFRVWSDEPTPRNVALASHGAKASGKARQIEDFPGAYGAQLTIDGKTGERFMAVGNDLTIELAKPTSINRVEFSSARGESQPEHPKFVFVAEYRIEVSSDGISWTEVSNGSDRQPARTAGSPQGAIHRDYRLLKLGTSDLERTEQVELGTRLSQVKRAIAKLPAPMTAWIGTRKRELAKGPFHVFMGGNPQKKGDRVLPRSLSVLDRLATDSNSRNESADQDQLATPGPPIYSLLDGASEAERRLELANWITHPSNPLTSRVLANRLWHYHFGVGIVSTPSDFGYMGTRPSHPELLDYLAGELLRNDWRIKPIHRQIMLSKTYRQSSAYREDGGAIDAAARLLWRFPPRRLSAEEVRDTILQISGSWMRASAAESKATDVPDAGPGFRLYHYMQDNVATYRPLDVHGPETYRRAVYHQNARASIVDLMTDFDQPDCAFSSPRRANTTTPLQALTLLNHQFSLDMADAMAKRLQDPNSDRANQIRHAFQLCFGRAAKTEELTECEGLVVRHGLPALCRALLNTSELIYVK